MLPCATKGLGDEIIFFLVIRSANIIVNLEQDDYS